MNSFKTLFSIFAFDSYNTAAGEEYDTEVNTVNYDFCTYVKMIPNIRVSNLQPLSL